MAFSVKVSGDTISYSYSSPDQLIIASVDLVGTYKPGKVSGGKGEDFLDLRVFNHMGGGVDVFLSASKPFVGMYDQTLWNRGYIRIEVSSIEHVMGTVWRDEISGNDKRNILIGDPSAVVAEPVFANDTIYGYGGNDEIYGMAGDDYLVGGAGADILHGGSGEDTASYDEPENKKGVVVNMLEQSMNTNDAKGDVLISIENILGTRFKDAIYGSDKNNDLFGLAGNDALYGNGGNDMLMGNDGDDRLFGGDGNDTLIGNSGRDYIDGGKGTDTIVFEARAITVDLTDNARNGGDAKGEIYLSIENVEGSSAGDTIIGNGRANKLYGEGGNDKLYGGDGKDTISGGDGDDRISGGAHSDRLLGGSGKDTFVFDTRLGSFNIDTIVDFEHNKDKIALDNDIFTKIGPIGKLSDKAFNEGTEAQDKHDRIIHDRSSGKLWYDADGTGTTKAVQFAVVFNASLDSGSFLIVA